MSEVFHRPSATIYTFPPRGRFASRDHRDSFVPPTELAPHRVSRSVVSGSGWYHEQAILDADRANNNGGPSSRNS